MLNPKDVNLLIVDDEEALRKAIVFDFKRKGFNVSEAENGKQAFEIVKNNNIDLVLTDVRMPGGDGVELLDKIKNHNPNLPVVMFITGFADITIEQAFDKGVAAVFAKPFDRKDLFAAVVKAVEDKKGTWAARRPERVDANFNVSLNFQNIDHAVQGRVINIGRGGIFVKLNDSFPDIGSKVSFKIQFQLNHLEGTGIVRWVRQESSEVLPSGCGIEFEYLSTETRTQVFEIINALKTRAYIPQS